MTTSEEGIELIKRWEGVKLSAYKDVAGVWTIGYGHTGPDVYEGKTISLPQAAELLRQDVARFEGYVNNYVTAPINQNQFDALVSFTYNLGPGNLSSSTLLKKVNANPNDPSIKDEFLKWKFAGGREYAGLLNRRSDEWAVYSGGLSHQKKKWMILIAFVALAAAMYWLWFRK